MHGPCDACRIYFSLGTVIKPKQIKCIPNEGMPSQANACIKGDLLVLFEVCTYGPDRSLVPLKQRRPDVDGCGRKCIGK